MGFIGYIGGSGIIKDLHITGAKITGTSESDISYTGGIAGSLSSSASITACYSSGTVGSTSSFAGGIAGETYGTLLSYYSTASVSGSNAAGGVVGSLGGFGYTVSCYWSGNADNGVCSIYTYSDYTDNTVKVENSEWSDAMSAMNTALSNNGYSYSYKENNGSDSKNFPLVLN